MDSEKTVNNCPTNAGLGTELRHDLLYRLPLVTDTTLLHELM